MKIKQFLSNLFFFLKRIGHELHTYRTSHPEKSAFGSFPEKTQLGYPCNIDHPENVYLDNYVSVKSGVRVIQTEKTTISIKKYTVIAANVTFIANSHTAAVSVPTVLFAPSHINDKDEDILVEEDVWIGTKATILSGVTLGRGCVVAACAVVTKSVPPYALVAGVPAKIIAVKFTLDDIKRHETALYPPEEHIPHEKLEKLFRQYYNGIRVAGCNRPLDTIEIDTLNKLKEKYGLNGYPYFAKVDAGE